MEFKSLKIYYNFGDFVIVPSFCYNANALYLMMTVQGNITTNHSGQLINSPGYQS